MDGLAGRADQPRHRKTSTVAQPPPVMIRRPRRVTGVLGAGVKAIGVLIAIAVAAAVLAGTTMVLWWAGAARIPVVFLVYGTIALAGCGFVLGRSGVLARWPRLPDGPGQLTWPPDGSPLAGLGWEPEDPAIGGPAGPEAEEDPG